MRARARACPRGIRRHWRRKGTITLALVLLWCVAAAYVRLPRPRAATTSLDLSSPLRSGAVAAQPVGAGAVGVGALAFRPATVVSVADGGPSSALPVADVVAVLPATPPRAPSTAAAVWAAAVVASHAPRAHDGWAGLHPTSAELDAFAACSHRTGGETAHGQPAGNPGAATDAVTAAAAVDGAATPLHVVQYNLLNGLHDQDRRHRVCLWLRAQRADVVTLNELNFWNETELGTWCVRPSPVTTGGVSLVGRATLDAGYPLSPPLPHCPSRIWLHMVR
jgi:hypothetical protein